MMELREEWEAKLGGGAVGCWEATMGGKKEVGMACENGMCPVKLRPPPLFRSISPTGVSAGLPPHRRLRAMFRRSRAVLPTNSHAAAPSQTYNRGDHLPQTRNLLDPSVRAKKHLSLPSSWTPTVLNRQCGEQPCLHPLPSPGTSRERQASWHGTGVVTPAGQSKGGAACVEERKRRKRTEGRKKKYSGKDWRDLSTQNQDGEGDGALCRWLESLGITDSEKDTPSSTITSNCQDRMLQGAGSSTNRAELSRRDRRPYFLPPISQPGGSLLDVPLFLPENSPPPSPCNSPGDPMFPLPVPPLQPLPPKRK